MNNTRAVSIAVLAIIGLAGCIDLTGPFPPPDHGDLTVTGVADRVAIRESESVTLSATAAGGTEPYVFRWSFNGGPETINPSETLAQQVTVGPFIQEGRYVYRVVVTDAEGRTAEDFVAIEVGVGVGVVLGVDNDEVLEGASVGFSTEVTDGQAPFTYAWSLAEGPIEINLAAETADTLRTPPLTTEGEYIFEVTVTDADGFSGTESQTITVNPIFEVDAPAILIAGEPASLEAVFEGDAEIDSYLWTVTQGSASIDQPAAESPMITATVGETAIVSLSVTFTNESDQEATVTHEAEVVSAESTRPLVRIETNFGDFVFELDADAAPITSANFLLLVDDGFFDGVLFHRNSCTNNPDTNACEPFVLQGGGYVREDSGLVLKDPPRDPIATESGNGLSNEDLYSVAMALSGGNANSAQTQFFINLDDNSFLDGQNFTVFASVVEGRNVVDAVAAMDRTDSTIIPGEVSLPVEDVIMERVSRVSP